MRSIITCHKSTLLLTMWALSALVGAPAQAVTLNFSAILNPGTCTFSLDKSTLALDSVHLSQLAPSTLQAAQPFTLTVQDCSGTDAALAPVVNVSGDGIARDSKWLFRSSDSTTSGVGVMLVKTDVPPGYGSTEVKNGDNIPLAAAGVNPLDQNIRFYAGITCGSLACTSERPTPGTLTARVLFNLAYR
ncbi:fimbrial protein [Serratia sp. D1N4]